MFARLTLGFLLGLKNGLQRERRTVLLGVRPDGRVVDVSGMSDGTLDQLYLSLRLATRRNTWKTNDLCHSSWMTS